MNIKDEAINYIAPETKNITELDKVSVDLNVEERTFKEGTSDEFTVKVVVIEEEDYRVPISVLKQLKVHLGKKPNMKFFSVEKSGEGLKTEYTVIPQ